MGEAAKNIMSQLAKSAPGVQGELRPAMSCKLMLRPGLAVFLNKAEHRIFEGRHQALDLKENTWVEMGPIRDEDVWVIEEQGDPGPEIWCLGVFLAVQIMDTVAVNNKKRVVTMQTQNLIATVPMSEIKQLERTLLYGDGQSSILSQ